MIDPRRLQVYISIGSVVAVVTALAIAFVGGL